MINRRSCGKRSAAEMRRSWHFKASDGRAWWAYCPEHTHMFGRWIEDGQVMHWVAGDPK